MTPDSEAEAVYDGLGEFHDLFMPAAWERLRPVLAATLGGFGPERRIVELGAGSGLGTRTIVAESAARVDAVEPSLVMRSILLSRVGDDETMAARVTVHRGRVPEVLTELDRPVAGVVCAHMLGHLDDDGRRAWVAWLDRRLEPDGVAVVTTQERHDTDVAEVDAAEQRRRLGERDYRAQYLDERDGRFTTRYQVWRDDALIEERVFTGPWEVVTTDDLAALVADTGLRLTVALPGVVVISRS